MNIYKLLRPLFFKINPEKAHDYFCRFLKFFPFFSSRKFFPDLKQKIFNKIFDNPFGLAAGFDKNAEMIDFFYKKGFGFTEIGSVTYESHDGNPKPRVFRLVEDESLLNSMGLNNKGVDYVYNKLKKSRRGFPLGANIAKTNKNDIQGDKAVDDIAKTYETISCLIDYITLNISCPNCFSEVGCSIKTFEDTFALDELLDRLSSLKSKPTLVKLSPDVGDDKLLHLIDVCEKYEGDGYVLSNSLRTDKGGLSGKRLRENSTEMIRLVYSYLNKDTIIIGVGGINSAESAYEKIKAGASLVQIFTGLIYEGFSINNLCNELNFMLKSDGFNNISDAVGVEYYS